jgi:hypothetical protein
MNRRLRSLVALLALAGFSALFAESLMAMSCVAADSLGQGLAVSPQHDGMHHPVPTSTDPESETGMPQHCPMAMAGSSCAAPASLPVTVSVVYAPAPDIEAAAIDADDASQELIVRILFHPPRS